MDLPAKEDRAVSPERPDLLWTPEIESEIETWQQTGVFPFQDLLMFPAPAPHYFSVEELRLIHHVAAISREMSLTDASNFTIWTRQVPL